MKKLAVFVFSAILAITMLGNCLAKEPREFVEEFFGSIKAGKVAEGYDRLFTGSGIPTMKPQAVEVLKTQTAGALPMFGKIVGFEKLREEQFGTSIVRLVYVLKCEKAPTIWEFYFYRPQASWFLANILFNDQFQLLEGKH